MAICCRTFLAHDFLPPYFYDETDHKAEAWPVLLKQFRQIKKQAETKMSRPADGAGGGTRTHTVLPPADFESATSTIPSHRLTPVHSSICAQIIQAYFLGENAAAQTGNPLRNRKTRKKCYTNQKKRDMIYKLNYAPVRREKGDASVKRFLQILSVFAAAMTLCLLTAGCSSLKLTASPDDLYCLPQLPDEYTELGDCIGQLMEDGAEYAAPISGTNIQPVQLTDLDGDGQEEALAFLRKSTDEKPLKIYIFSQGGETYQQTAVIESSGTAIYSIAYSDLDKDGWKELIVGWKVGTELQALTVYSLTGKEPTELMRSNYVKYAVTEPNEHEPQELVVFRSDDEGSGVADCYVWAHGSMTLSSTARLSMTMAELNAGKVVSGMLTEKTSALFVSGVSDSGEEITDILTTKNRELTNISLSAATGVSTEIYRYISTLFPSDINDDEVIEVPSPVRLPQPQDYDVGEPDYRIDWLAYDENGQAKTVLSTYHNVDDGWYLTLPSEWRGNITVGHSQTGIDEQATTFSIRSGSTGLPEPFLRIYTITGESREYKAVRGNRFILSRQAEVIYSAELLSGNEKWEHSLTEDELHQYFNLIAKEWTAGDN
jgi:alkylhydroperoxidase/carboxymuconolactone decarboxylase family protein YurZ